ncbi:MAG: hypothetical protein R3362_01610, partial [Rhodothermales bacterium]|nr:hypothetical protein [Rhodothermales bacterium]
MFVEGFDVYYNDPAKRRTWQDIYELLSEEGFAESLYAKRHDIVIFKLHNATDYVQRNAFALIDLLDTLEAELLYAWPRKAITVVGPSMGGLIGRYGLAYRETLARDGSARGASRVRTFVSVDAPQRGANVPLGDQFFCEFFNTDSDTAQACTDALNSVAARQ